MNWLRRVLGRGSSTNVVGVAAGPGAVATTAGVAPAGSLGVAFDHELAGDFAAAEAAYRGLLQLEPANAEAKYLLGRLLRQTGRASEAITILRQALSARPSEVPYLIELARAQIAAARYAEAAETFAACVRRQPDCTDVLNDYAGALLKLDRHDEAEAVLERRVRLWPAAPEAYFNLGVILSARGHADAAIATYRKGLALAPQNAAIHSNLVLQMNYSQNEDATSICAEQQRFGAQFAAGFVAPMPDPTWPRRLRVGYISPDFRDHVVMRFMEGIIENHDARQFEIHVYHTHPQKDYQTERLRAAVSRWADVEQLGAAELADLIRRDRIDILVDLAGHTDGNSLLTMALKPAPVQATYLGYPNSTGLGAVDWRITDAQADPPGESDRLSTEKLLRLPGSYFCYRPGPGVPEVNTLPAQASGAITFGCFNNFAKLSAGFLEAAAQLLLAVPGSRLVLKNRQLSSAKIAAAVRATFERAGIGPHRVELRGWEPSNSHHLAVYGAIDIALDSFPYNGATTSCEALWMGVPVVTLAGDRHAGRMGASILNAVGLGELVATTPQQYVETSAQLAGDPDRLAKLRSSLRARMRQSPIMDEAGFTRRLEQAYVQIWQQQLQARGAAAGVDAGLITDRLKCARELRAAARLTEASDLCESILRVDPAQVEALTLRWDLAFDSGLPGTATDWLSRAIAVSDSARARYMLGCVQQAQGQYPAAEASFRRSLALDPASARAHNNLGCLAEAEGRLTDAEAHYRQAAAIDQQLAPALYNLGNLHRQLGQLDPAVDWIRRALVIDSSRADWHCNLGALLLQRSELDAAAVELRAAVAIDPRFYRAQLLMAGLHWTCGRVDAVAAALESAVQSSDRADIASEGLRLLHYRDGCKPDELLAAHRAWADRYARGTVRFSGAGGGWQQGATGRLRVGYLVTGQTDRARASHFEPLLTQHDRQQFEIIVYVNGVPDAGLAQALRRQAVLWRDISQLSDEVAAHRMRADGVDILVDLAGHGASGRMLLLARKPAPVQLSWFGYPGATGLDAMDFRLTDVVADPVDGTEQAGAERAIRLPAGALCYVPPADLAGVALSEQRATPPAVFGSVAPLACLSEQALELWTAALRQVPQSRLLIVADGLYSQHCRSELQERLGSHGLAPERFELRATPRERAQAYSGIDILLDTTPVNDVTAACEALWLGLPVLTLAGTASASRRVASVLRTAGLSQWVADSPSDYVAKAAELAGRSDKLRTRFRSSPVMDAAAFTRQVEVAYRQLFTAGTSFPDPAA
jgi:predicted O-linked N-acetylglucosamine transferase (SPINDLY family)